MKNVIPHTEGVFVSFSQLVSEGISIHKSILLLSFHHINQGARNADKAAAKFHFG
jgi:hypothetical protein